MTFVAALFVVAFLPMIVEARRSAANERALRAAGATEPAGDVYQAMQIAYPACFAAMIAEAWLRGAEPAATTAAGAVIVAAGKAIKYWAIAALGPLWSFRVLVPPSRVLVTRGPYRWLRHPNYIGLAGELIGFALLAGAPWTGTLSAVGFGALVLARIRVEERALGLRDNGGGRR